MILFCKKKKDKKILELKQKYGVWHIEGCQNMEIKTYDEAMEALEAGNKIRATGITDMNERSSRSHSVLIVEIAKKIVMDEKDVITKGKLYLVDLAGSERLSKTSAKGQRFMEAIGINSSLFV